MNTRSSTLSAASPVRLPQHTCPACGMAAPAVLALLPSGRRALIEACAICGRKKATPLSAEQTSALMEGKEASQVIRREG